MRSNQGLTPVRKTTIIGSALLVLALVVAWMFVLSPRSDAIAKVNEDVTVAEDANQALRGKITTLRAREQELPDLRKVSKALDRRFPPTADQAKLYKMITAAAAEAGIAPQFITGVSVEPPAAVGGATSAQLPGVAMPINQIAGQAVTISAVATPTQIREFVANLEQLPRAFAVSTISLTKQGRATTGSSGTAGGTPNVDPESTTATITGNMFIMPKVVDPSGAANATKAG